MTLKISNQAQKMEVRDEVMVLSKVDDGGRENLKPAVHPICSFCEHTNEPTGTIWEDYYNLFAEESSLPIASPVYEDFEEVYRPTLHDEYDDSFL